MNRETIWERKFDEYVMVRERIWLEDEAEAVTTTTMYTHNGEYIGNPRIANYLTRKRGIVPELVDDTKRVCSVGYCPSEEKWYGWSHRAICGFGIGDRIYDDNYGDDNTPFVSHGAFTITNGEEARQAAVNFAESVS